MSYAQSQEKQCHSDKLRSASIFNSNNLLRNILNYEEKMLKSHKSADASKFKENSLNIQK